MAMDNEFPHKTAKDLVESIKSNGSEPRMVDEWKKLFIAHGFDYILRTEKTTLVRREAEPYTDGECSRELIAFFLRDRCRRRLKMTLRALGIKCEPRGEEEEEIVRKFLLDGNVPPELHLIKERKNKKNIRLVPDCSSHTAHLIYDEVVKKNSTVFEITSPRSSLTESLRLSHTGQFGSIEVIDRKNVMLPPQVSGFTLFAVSLGIGYPLLIAVGIIGVLVILSLICCYWQNRKSPQEDNLQETERTYWRNEVIAPAATRDSKLPVDHL